MQPAILRRPRRFYSMVYPTRWTATFLLFLISFYCVSDARQVSEESSVLRLESLLEIGPQGEHSPQQAWLTQAWPSLATQSPPKFSNQTQWFRLHSQGKDTVIKFEYARLELVELWILDHGTFQKHAVTGLTIPLNHRTYRSTALILPLPNEKVSAYIAVRTTSPISLLGTIQPRNDFAINQGIVEAFQVGIATAAGLLLVVVGIATARQGYPWIGVTTASLGVCYALTTASLNGLDAVLLWPTMHWWSIRSVNFFILLASGSLMHLVFLTAQRYHFVLHKAIHWGRAFAMTLLIVTITVNFLFRHPIVSLLCNISLAVTLGTASSVLPYLGKTRGVPRWHALSIMTAFLAAVLTLALHEAFQFSGANMILSVGLLLSSVFQVIALAMQTRESLRNSYSARENELATRVAATMRLQRIVALHECLEEKNAADDIFSEGDQAIKAEIASGRLIHVEIPVSIPRNTNNAVLETIDLQIPQEETLTSEQKNYSSTVIKAILTALSRIHRQQKMLDNAVQVSSEVIEFSASVCGKFSPALAAAFEAVGELEQSLEKTLEVSDTQTRLAMMENSLYIALKHLSQSLTSFQEISHELGKLRDYDGGNIEATATLFGKNSGVNESQNHTPSAVVPNTKIFEKQPT